MGVAETFTEFMDSRRAPMLKFAMVLTGDFHISEEIVAIVFARAFELWGRIGAMEHPQAYVRKMIVNEHLTWRRRQVSSALATNELERRVQAEPDFSLRVDEREAVIARLAQLTAHQRAAVVLRYYLDMSDNEIADHLGCARATARSHLSHAAAALRLEGLHNSELTGGDSR